MNLETFNEAIQLMCDTHPCQHQESRVKALFEFFGDVPWQQVKEAAKLVSREEERFPTPKTFGEYVGRVTRPRTQEEMERALCNRCDGYGWVMMDGLAYRGKCQHGARLSTKTKEAPESYRSDSRKPTISDEDLEVYVNSNEDALKRGLVWMEKHGICKNVPVLQRIRELLLTCPF
jgi:hypothetical protein